jgi:chromosomal replication initiation ATPase DnaA
LQNIKREQIRQRFPEDIDIGKMEQHAINLATTQTDELLDRYLKLPESRNGAYINSDLMKMTFKFYAESLENRRKYNMSVTNSAAVLTNELYIRTINNNNIKRSIFILGPYGAGKSYFAQALFENKELLDDSIVYEGSITPPAFDEKVQLAIDNGITPYIIALNPTLELSLNNIRERAQETGRNVEKKEVLDKFSNFYNYMVNLVQKFKGIDYLIYNKETNAPLTTDCSSKNLEDLYHGSREEIEIEYDRIIKALEQRDNVNKISLKHFLKDGLTSGLTFEDTSRVKSVEELSKNKTKNK